jgi:hypothetical protein
MAMHVRVILVREKHVMEAEQLNGWTRLASSIGKGLVLAGHQYLFHNMLVDSALQWTLAAQGKQPKNKHGSESKRHMVQKC